MKSEERDLDEREGESGEENSGSQMFVCVRIMRRRCSDAAPRVSDQQIWVGSENLCF